MVGDLQIHYISRRQWAGTKFLSNSTSLATLLWVFIAHLPELEYKRIFWWGERSSSASFTVAISWKFWGYTWQSGADFPVISNWRCSPVGPGIEFHPRISNQVSEVNLLWIFKMPVPLAIVWLDRLSCNFSSVYCGGLIWWFAIWKQHYIPFNHLKEKKTFNIYINLLLTAIRWLIWK